MPSEWIARRKKDVEDERSRQREITRREAVLKAKGPELIGALAGITERLVAELEAELVEFMRFRFNKTSRGGFQVHTTEQHPLIHVSCEIDQSGKHISIEIDRTQSGTAPPQNEVVEAPIGVRRADDLFVTFRERRYRSLDSLAAHILEYAVFGEDPPAPQRSIGLVEDDD